MKVNLTEFYLVEEPAINWFKDIGYLHLHGSELSPDNDERDSYRDVILKKRFITVLKNLNPWLNDSQALEVYKKITQIEHPDFIVKGKIFYDMLTGGVRFTFKEGREKKTRIVRLVDFENVHNNDFLVANQFTVEHFYETNEFRRPDIVVFINGIPVSAFELKSPNSYETAKDAFNDHKTKMNDIPQLYMYTQMIVVSDGKETRYGSPLSDWERFFIWEGIDDEDDVEVIPLSDGCYNRYKGQIVNSLEILIKGLFKKEHIIDYLQDFIHYEKIGEGWNKKIAMYHQFYAVRKAVKRTVECVVKGKTPNEKRIGTIWHTQGSGKSLTMLFYAKKVLKQKELENPLILFITDRKELDEQLYGVFADISIAEREPTIKSLQETLKNKTGGIVFATIQKFGLRGTEEYPFLSDRENIIVVADEAHRSQYRELAQNLRKAIPNASFIGFTATPIELEDRDTYLVFGEPISVYSMDIARRHNVIVPIYYEPRLVELHLTNEFIDEEFEQIFEEVVMDEEAKESLKRKFARLEELIIAEERIRKIARDVVEHFNNRKSEFIGKALVVTISRKVAVRLYEEIVKIPGHPSIVVVMSGNKKDDPPEFYPHIRNENELKELAKRFKNPDSEPEMAIVVDMWLTGFDVPCLHTMYFDKPIKGHSLVQAIARVNRVFKDKPGGLIVDYIGIADDLKKSLGKYAVASQNILADIEEVINMLKEKYDVIHSFFYGLEYKNWKKLSSDELSRLTVIAYEKVIESEEKKKSFLKNFIALKKLYALASPHPETIKIKEDIKFFEMIKKMIVKYETRNIKEIYKDIEYEMTQLISKSITSEEPVDIFSLMSKEKPDISVLDDVVLERIKEIEYKNYACQILSKLIKEQIIVREKINPFRFKKFSEMLQELIEKHNNKLITTAEVIEKLIEIAKEIKKAEAEGKNLNLDPIELAFYDMLIQKRELFKNEKIICEVAKQIVKEMGYYIKMVDWNRKEYIKAKIRSKLKTILSRKIEEIARYEEIDELANEIINHAEDIFAFAA